jgi:hypothetical protein
MNTTYNKNRFTKLSFDHKCLIIEALMPDDYFNGQEEIGFYIPENFDHESTDNLPPTPPEIEQEENEKFEALIENLIEKLFKKFNTIDFDIEEYEKQLLIDNEQLLN